MRRMFYTLVLGVLLSSSVGCFLPIYSGDPTQRAEELIYTSEDLRAFVDTWRRIWFRDMPDHMSPQRVHGGVL